MSYRVDDGRRYGDRAEAGELARLRAENNRLRAALKRARIDATLEFNRAQSNFKRGQELWRERNEARAELDKLRQRGPRLLLDQLDEARAEVKRLRAEVNRLHATRAPELTLAEIVGPELAEQEAARAERDELRAENERLQDDLDVAVDWLCETKDDLDEARQRAIEQEAEAMQLRRERDDWKDAYYLVKREEVRLRAERDGWKQSYFRMGRKRLEAKIGEIQARRWAVQGYRLMREIDELLGDAPFTSWDDLRYVLRRYREGRL